MKEYLLKRAAALSPAVASRAMEIVLLAAALLSFVAFLAAASKHCGQRWAVVVVQPEDTVCEIAGRCSDGGEDVGPTAAEFAQANGLRSLILPPGTVLLLPEATQARRGGVKRG